MIRPALGNFGRNEWAIIGAPCGDIKSPGRKVHRGFISHSKNSLCRCAA
jgi:molybdopterin-guanine dinucleotide biosynthesis protein A